MMELTMSDDTPLSPLRGILCSRSNALRVAAWMRQDGFEPAVIATDEPLQPWRIVDAFLLSIEETRVCA
jgi:hypothetical protein